jgi:hypothetical protein
MSFSLDDFQTINDNEVAECSFPLYVNYFNKENIGLILNKKVLVFTLMGGLMLYVLYSSIIDTKEFLLRAQINDDDNTYRSRPYFFSP